MRSLKPRLSWKILAPETVDLLKKCVLVQKGACPKVGDEICYQLVVNVNPGQAIKDGRWEQVGLIKMTFEEKEFNPHQGWKKKWLNLR